jgi:hypothetical protein
MQQQKSFFIGFEAQSGSYLMDSRTLFPGFKRPDLEADQYVQLSSQARRTLNYISFHNA